MKGCLFVILWCCLAGWCLSSFPLDCEDVYTAGNFYSGVYKIYPAGGPGFPLYVYCDMYTDGGVWTVFQRRQDGSVNFYRGWNDYKLGFGNATGEYWLGLQNIHLLTMNRDYQLRVDLQDFEGKRAYAFYSSFALSAYAISGETDGYTLSVYGFGNGGAGDSLSSHSGRKFSTFDRDQDGASFNCAMEFRGAFWYHDCHSANLNGVYYQGNSTLHGKGIHWVTWRGLDYSLKGAEMKIRVLKKKPLKE
ncbi:microfibril-associated glycoprotein 4-like [Acipenser ruthenus]|uniref:microfibril-associated glycoprotein 4-like n=1 Tax=Acipenser ruthenus TaxID=7906 RepID=UPI00145BBCFC|nr:microfibril-associated glycoprotein 4-like [Acipenser ruthenus]